MKATINLFVQCSRRSHYLFQNDLSNKIHVYVYTFYFRCIAISPLKKMEWMTARAAKRKIIPLVILASLGYVSFRCLTVVKADPGILACDAVSGTSLVVRYSLNLSSSSMRPCCFNLFQMHNNIREKISNRGDRLVDSSFVIQFSRRFPPKCANHVNPY